MTQLARIGGSTPQFHRWDDLLRDAAGDAGALLAALQQAPAADRAGLAARTLDALSDAQLSALAAQPRGAETLRALRDAAADAPAGAPGADARVARADGALRQADEARLAKEKQELLLDLGQIALDIVGIFEPTPFADLTNAGISIWRGNWLDAGLSAVGVIPYLGDAAKLGKLGKFGKVIERAVELAKLDPGFADQLRPALRKIKDAIDAAPVDSLPGPARDAVRSMKGKLDEFFSGAAKTPTTGPRMADGTPLPANVKLDLRGTSVIDPAAASRLTDASRLPQVSNGKVEVTHGPEAGTTKTVILSKEAGQTVTKDGYTITKDANGFPIFNSRFDTFVPDHLLGTGKEADHFRYANERLGTLLRQNPELAKDMGLDAAQVKHLTKQPPSSAPPPGLTWHHHQDVGRMQLVVRAEHQAHVPHTGGMSIWGGGYK
ncbi:HNH endonuclease [Vulcaniibacterium thermophilum]|uniref:HNH endonuclease n=1 Tax=Vulcaniibacterium thermophilum TaxID=1169913 RepID=A0A919DAB0_9GAMM|nr:HNH endonuclease [Vulcaniibacterium thermophilum]GHE25757.1 hypothetical protein GCM10007167_03280 [Vulcaniibacterium thermophilum]